MRMSQRELMLLIVTSFSILFGGAIMTAKPKIEHLKGVMAKQEEVRWQIDRDKKLAARKSTLALKYDELSKLLPPATSDDMGVHWQQVLERVASKNNFTLRNSKADLEKKIGDVYELLIDCKDWEGNLDSTAHFLFDLQAEGAMLDVRRMLVMSTSTEKLRGTFALYCAYTRAQDKTEADVKEDTK
jgi:hypothetical protein